MKRCEVSCVFLLRSVVTLGVGETLSFGLLELDCIFSRSLLVFPSLASGWSLEGWWMLSKLHCSSWYCLVWVSIRSLICSINSCCTLTCRLIVLISSSWSRSFVVMSCNCVWIFWNSFFVFGSTGKLFSCKLFACELFSWSLPSTCAYVGNFLRKEFEEILVSVGPIVVGLTLS